MTKHTLTVSVAFLLITLTVSSNIDNGQFNIIISGANNNIRSGQFNVVDGSKNGIEGDKNYISGDLNEANGNGNIILGTGNKVVDSEEQFFRALSLRNSRLSDFVSGSNNNIAPGTVVTPTEDNQSSAPNVVISSSNTQDKQNQAEGLGKSSQAKFSFSTGLSSDLSNRKPQIPQGQIAETPPIRLPQVQIKPATSIKGTTLAIEETQKASQIMRPNSPNQQSINPPSLTQSQQTISTLGQNQNQQKINNVLFPNLVQVKEVINPSPAEFLAQNVDKNSNYRIREPVIIKEITEDTQDKQTQNQVLDYGIGGPVLIQDYTQKEPIKIKDETHDVSFFGEASSSQQGAQSTVKQEKVVEGLQVVKVKQQVEGAQSTVKQEKIVESLQVVKVKQQVNPSPQEQILPQQSSQQPKLNLRSHIRKDIQTELAKSEQHPSDKPLIRNQKEEVVEAVKFILYNHPTDIPSLGMTLQPIGKAEYVELAFGPKHE